MRFFPFVRSSSVIWSLIFAFSFAAQAQNAQRPFDLIPSNELRSDKVSPASVQEIQISIRPEARELFGAFALEIPLSDGKVYQARRVFSEMRALNDLTWHGKLSDGSFRGDVILTYKNGYIAGLIYSRDAVYEIVPRGNEQLLLKLDQRLFPESGEPLVPVETKVQQQNGLMDATPDSGDRQDILILYTTATKNFLGGDAQAQALAQQAVDVTNAAYLNSRIRTRLRLVHSQEHAFVETGVSSNDLSALRANATVQALRNTYQADLVSMLGEVRDVCGIGYLIGGATQGGSAYTIVARSCAVGNLTLAHEIGHNQGSGHNPENSGTAAYPFSYGHYINGNYRTIMSYSDPCTNGCPKAPHFSNPLISYNGFPTGITDQRDNSRSINNTADNVANYRVSTASIRLLKFRNGETFRRRIGQTITWSSNNVAGNLRFDISYDEGLTWQTLIANTANDGTEPVNISGRATKRARLRIVSLADPAISDSSPRNFGIL